MTYQVDILNPKATELLQELVDLKLITISEIKDESLLNVIKRLRKKAETNPPTLEEITNEVENIRAKRYANKAQANH